MGLRTSGPACTSGRCSLRIGGADAMTQMVRRAMNTDACEGRRGRQTLTAKKPFQATKATHDLRQAAFGNAKAATR